ncbi:MAG TPA: lytic transglycosylase domain-containing protein [Azospirillum sp.]|nr:lytic transglycosylase domain-containing protein [Azospirillum sp.]
MILPLALFAQLAAHCGPVVHVETLAAVARTESGFNVLAIGDNTAGAAYAPATPAEAIATANALLARGHSLDLGLMQINSATLGRLGMTVADAFDPCRSIAGGARVLSDGYRPAPGEDAQRALARALSRYNTGSPVRGLANGYVTKVQASAAQVVPAIRVEGWREPAAGGVHGAIPPAADSAALPPSWDVYGRARLARRPAPPPTAGRSRDPPRPSSSPAADGH